MKDSILGILNRSNICITNSNVDAKSYTVESMKVMMSELQKAADKIPKPEHDCFVFTQEVWDRVKEECPITTFDSSYTGKFDGLLFYVEPDEATARARAILLVEEGVKPMVFV